MRLRSVAVAVLVAALLVPTLVVRTPVAAAAGECDTSKGEVYFPQTNKCALKVFHDYWLANGGLAQQGFPISDDFTEISATDGKEYVVQYFERARFEHHPESTDPRYKVLLGLVGGEQFRAKYPQGAGAPQGACAAGEQFFEQTRFCVPARFFAYWAEHGGLAQQGLPLSPAFMETSPADNKQYLTQYFERARFEYHPENADPRYKVLLGLLGGEQYDARYPGITPVEADSLNDGAFETKDTPEVQTRYDRGGYRITVKAPESFEGAYYAPANSSPVAAINRLGLDDQRLEVEFTRIAGPADGTMELTCRFSKADPNRYVLFAVGPGDGYYTITAYFGAGDNDRRRIAGGPEAAPNPLARVGDAPTRLRADCIGDTFTLYVNGQKVAEGRDSTITGGEQAGFSVGTFENGGMDVVLRNFTFAIPGR